MNREVGTDMKISTFKAFFIDALKSLRRNKTISLASAITVSATLFIFGIFLLLALNINENVNNVESKIEIKVYLKDDVTLFQQRDIENKLKGSEGVKEVVFESKSEALNNFREQLKENKGILSGYDSSNNPMQNAFIVRLEKPEFADSASTAVKDMTGIDEVVNDRDLINKISAVSNTIRWAGVVLFIVLIGVSLFLIGNTIKLTVFSRRREIGIMKFVGATDWFIRWPFIIEGVVIGLVGAILSNLTLYYSYKLAFSAITQQLITVPLVSPAYILGSMMWEFILAGISIGALGSILSLRKFLAV